MKQKRLCLEPKNPLDSLSYEDFSEFRGFVDADSNLKNDSLYCFTKVDFKTPLRVAKQAKQGGAQFSILNEVRGRVAPPQT